jgi:hypothetical protein
VIAVKSGRVAEGARPAASHTGARAGETLWANYSMLALAKKFGFEFRPLDDGQTVALRLNLEQAS